MSTGTITTAATTPTASAASTGAIVDLPDLGELPELDAVHGPAFPVARTVEPGTWTPAPPRRLDGPVTTIVSTRSHGTRLHLDPNCDGLERVPDDARGTITFAGTDELATSDLGRPCRLCCLETVLFTVIADATDAATDAVADAARAGDRGWDHAPVLFTCTSQPVGTGPFGGHDPHTPTGQQRLVRIADRFGWAHTTTTAGIAAWGTTSAHAARILARNLRTHRLSRSGRGTANAAQIECFWTLADDRDRSGDAAPSIWTIWNTAKLLTR